MPFMRPNQQDESTEGRKKNQFSFACVSCLQCFDKVGPNRAGFKCVEALGRIIVRGLYPPSNDIIYIHLQL